MKRNILHTLLAGCLASCSGGWSTGLALSDEMKAHSI